MQFYKIEVDERVWKYLKSKAEPFEDSPNSVLNRILFSERKPNLQRQNNEISKTNPSPFPDGIPKALAQILEVLYEVKVSGLNRNEATNLVAQRRGTAPQTVIDKYCRQLNKKAFEIDRLLEDENIGEFRSLLEKRFVNHKDIVDSFFNDIYEKIGMEEYYA